MAAVTERAVGQGEEDSAVPPWVPGLHMAAPFIFLIGLCCAALIIRFSPLGAAAVACFSLLVTFGATFFHEVHRTPWNISEAQLMFLIMGHVVALPVRYAIEYQEQFPSSHMLAATLVCAPAMAMFMAGGGVWALRRLNALGEKDTLRRLFYLVVGMCVFPSMISWLLLIPDDFRGMGVVCLSASPVVWVLARHLNQKVAELKRDVLRKKAATA